LRSSGKKSFGREFPRLAAVSYVYILNLRFINANNIIYYFDIPFARPPNQKRGLRLISGAIFSP
jgi:hypothetical protein